MRALVLVLALAAAPLSWAAPASAPARADTVAEQRIPFKQSETSATGMALRVVGSLIVVLGIAVGAMYLLKRYLPALQRAVPGGASHIKVLEARRLTTRATLFLVEVDGARLLLGQTGDHITTLHRGDNKDS